MEVLIATPCDEDKHNIAYAVGVGWYCPHCLCRLILSHWYQPTQYALIDGESLMQDANPVAPVVLCEDNGGDCLCLCHKSGMTGALGPCGWCRQRHVDGQADA